MDVKLCTWYKKKKNINRLLTSITTPVATSERLISLYLQTEKSFTNLIYVYGLTLQGTAEVKDNCYGMLDEAIK